jgi:hypothetical protein
MPSPNRRQHGARHVHVVVLIAIIGGLMGWASVRTWLAVRSTNTDMLEMTRASRPAEADPTDAPPIAAEELARRAAKSVVLRFVNEQTRMPAVALKVVARSSQFGTFSGTTDSAGAIDLPSATTWSVETESEEYFRLVITRAFDMGMTTLELSPAARLSITVRTPDGAPISGIRLCLIPPLARNQQWEASWQSRFDGMLRARDQRLASQLDRAQAELEVGSLLSDTPARFKEGTEWSHESIDSFATRDNLVRVTDSEGNATWSLFPLVNGYRWGVLSERDLLSRPAHERPRFRLLADGQIRLDIGAPQRLSGVLDFVPGETYRIDAVGMLPGVITGRIELSAGSPLREGHVRLLHSALDGSGTVVERQQESSTLVLPDGTFVFKGAAPGDKRLRAVWQLEDGGIRCGSCEFTLAPSEALDVGTLKASSGSTVTIRPRLRDGEGNELEVQEVFDDAELAVKLQLVLSPSSRLPVDFRMEEVLTTVGADLQLIGMPNGSLSIRATDHGRWSTRGNKQLMWCFPRNALVAEIERDTLVDVPILVERLVRCSFEASVPAGSPIGGLAIHALNTSTGYQANQVLVRQEIEKSNGKILWQPSLPIGTYTVLVAPDQTFSPDDQNNYYALAEFHAISDADSPFELDLRPGCIMEGRCVDSTGAPRGGAGVGVRIGPWLESANGGDPYDADCDADGRFRIRGLPPNEPFVVSNSTRGTTCAAGGTIQVVHVVDAR